MSSQRQPASVPEKALLEFVRGQRWFSPARGAEPSGLGVLDQGQLSLDPPLLDVLVEVRFGNGLRDVYQLLLEGSPDGAESEAVGAAGLAEVLERPATAAELLALAADEARIATWEGTIEFATAAAHGRPRRGEVRPLGVEQTNSSIVVAEELIVKLYRRLEAGVNPELELLRFLAAHGFANAPALAAWWSYSGAAMSATLGMAQRFIAGAVDGWSLALEELSEAPEAFLGRIGRLGEVLGEMHRVLASEADDPAFAPEEPSRETLALLTATVDDEIEELFERLPDEESVAPIVGCGDAVRALLRSLGTFGSVGQLIREHGDLHLGQVLWSGRDWYVVDFEGEPARSLAERRAKRSPLRDVAGMLRSLTYAATVTGAVDGAVEEQARAAFLEAYLAAVEPAAILPAPDQIERLLAIFELEKAVYELRYELAHRPDWVYVPVAGIRQLLDRSTA
jgi:maltokinase